MAFTPIRTDLRQIALLSGGTTKINPSHYHGHTNLKTFDSTSTKILRVQKHCVRGLVKEGRRVRSRVIGHDHYLVYGMRAVGGKKKPEAEVYDMVVNEDMVPAAMARVAAHCGIEDLLPA